MALVPLASHYAMNDARLSIDIDEFTAAVSQVQFDPSAQTGTWRGISGNVVRAQSAAEWSCTLGLAQDLAPAGLLRYLLDHEGETKTVVFTPVDGGPTVTADLIMTPGTIGGTAGSDVATSTVTLAVVGKPVFDDTPGA